MSHEKYEGITEALEYAEDTGQSVNVGLNRGGEGVKIEGIIKKVGENFFRILLEETGQIDTVAISEVEYVEYS
ncbi:hypothetical protein UF75_3406 [Desulfosporosinus sp. I2]|uniref:hypothetical protein n=1 Tax=Desulfosporosinus sp. I2 TaxID=1617025 RepID=UPI0005ED5CB1|nr:hypothetical protein [Desulfosporosinus sp. I2]KJR46202.1 hypothetical protein UF75_3406 [Desulfosporosinus sp. I2]